MFLIRPAPAASLCGFSILRRKGPADEVHRWVQLKLRPRVCASDRSPFHSIASIRSLFSHLLKSRFQEFSVPTPWTKTLRDLAAGGRPAYTGVQLEENGNPE